ncbi:unnamed protein product, partial [Brenthis ino]
MLVTVKISKMNAELVKKLLDVRPIYNGIKKKYSQKIEDIFKFYKEDECHANNKYRVLEENDYDRFISKRAMIRQPSLTRHITSMGYKVGKEMFSLAEGMPNEAIFPFTRLELTTRSGGSLVLDEKDLASALQYIPSQGLPSLLTEIRQFQQELHRPPPIPGSRDVIVTNGSQHGIYQCVELLVNDGDPVITTEYSYTGFYSSLRPYNPEIIGIPEDEHGLVPETLESILNNRLACGLKMPKMMYLIPTGNNPTGTVIPEDRRRIIYELACKYDFIIVEDDPYMFLNYDGNVPPSFISMDVCGRVIRLDSFSKVISAGLRAAWMTAPSALLHRAELHAQAELLHSNSLGQAILFRLLSNRNALASHLHSTRSFYELRRSALSAALRGVEGLAEWVEPSAGLFHWLHVRGVEDVYNMVFHTALQRGLMLIPGHAFLYDTRAPCQYIRLAFSKIKLEDMEPAVGHLADIIRLEQKLKQTRRVATEG